MLKASSCLATVFLSATVAASAQGALKLSPGASAAFRLAETPSTGYGWRIDEAASDGLGHVSIADDGRKPGAHRPGAPGTHGWTIVGVSPGRATIQFVYQRPWEPAPVETRRLDVEVGPPR